MTIALQLHFLNNSNLWGFALLTLSALSRTQGYGSYIYIFLAHKDFVFIDTIMSDILNKILF